MFIAPGPLLHDFNFVFYHVSNISFIMLLTGTTMMTKVNTMQISVFLVLLFPYRYAIN